MEWPERVKDWEEARQFVVGEAAYLTWRHVAAFEHLSFQLGIAKPPVKPLEADELKDINMKVLDMGNPADEIEVLANQHYSDTLDCINEEALARADGEEKARILDDIAARKLKAARMIENILIKRLRIKAEPV